MCYLFSALGRYLRTRQNLPPTVVLTMTTLRFTPNLLRHVDTPTLRVEGGTVREVLDRYFQTHPLVRGYVLDDQGAVRKHVAIFLNQTLIHDRVNLSDPVQESDDVFVAQALSGG